MKKDLLEELSTNQEILKHFDLLKGIGIWDHITALNNEIMDLQELLKEAEEIFSQHSIIDLIRYVTERFLDKFIPSYLTFIFQENASEDVPEIITYKNMKLVETDLKIASIEPYKYFFTLSPTSVAFSVFEYMIGRPGLTDLFKPLDPRIVVPIMGIGGVNGFILIGNKVVGNDYTSHEIAYIDILMKFASISLQNNIHYKRAITDFKTNLYNHSYFTMRLDEEVKRVQRYKSELSVLVLDVDNFKHFNDTYGHLAGDLVLSDLAHILKETLRDGDIAGRFGGEEFVAMLIACDEHAAFIVAERIRKNIAEHSVYYEGNTLKVTVSIGLTHLKYPDIRDSSTLFNEADTALYLSKEGGRNRCSVYLSELNF